MCFSAPVSFSAAVGLGAIGCVSLVRTRSAKELPLAAIPLLFAAQQACEGFVWRVLEHAPFHVESTPWARAFLFFALLVWPVYIPLALWLAEPKGARQTALLALVGVGAVLGAYLMARATFRDSNACIAFGNLYYWVQIETPIKRVVLASYLATIVVPFIVSSLRGTYVAAFVIVVSFGVTALLYRAGFASVWCFFAAVMSGAIACVKRPTTRTTQGAVRALGSGA
jgi:hypothetical protein